MKAADVHRFERALTRMAAGYLKKELPPETRTAYFDQCREYPIEVVERAIKLAVGADRGFMPTPGLVLAQVDTASEQLERERATIARSRALAQTASRTPAQVAEETRKTRAQLDAFYKRMGWDMRRDPEGRLVALEPPEETESVGAILRRRGLSEPDVA